MNKQGALNEFLDISSGSGTHAPRQRQAYASKRLQQVISDFRKQQKNSSVAPTSRSPSRATSRDPGSGNESHHSDPEPPAAKKRKTNAKSVRGGRVEGRKRGSRAKSRKDTTEQDIVVSDDGDDFVPPQDIAPGESAGRELRPRVKPRPAYRAAKEREVDTLISNDE